MRADSKQMKGFYDVVTLAAFITRVRLSFLQFYLLSIGSIVTETDNYFISIKIIENEKGVVELFSSVDSPGILVQGL
jgi:hypothetical protein